MNSSTRTVLALLGLLGGLPLAPLCALASAPSPLRQDPPKGNQAPHVDCIVCGERSYTFPSGAPVDKDGNMIVWCSHCKRDTAHRSNTNTSPGVPTSTAYPVTAQSSGPDRASVAAQVGAAGTEPK